MGKAIALRPGPWNLLLHIDGVSGWWGLGEIQDEKVLRLLQIEVAG